MTRRKRKANKQPDAIRPTPEREARNETVSAGMARRVKPMIDVLRDRGILSTAQHEILHYYRDQANLAEKSPVRSCCDNTPRGGDGMPGAAIISARLEVERMHGQLAEYHPGLAHDLRNVIEAVARDDKSLSAYCVEKYGGRERYDGRGRFIAMVPKNERASIGKERAHLLKAARVISR